RGLGELQAVLLVGLRQLLVGHLRGPAGDGADRDGGERGVLREGDDELLRGRLVGLVGHAEGQGRPLAGGGRVGVDGDVRGCWQGAQGEQRAGGGGRGGAADGEQGGSVHGSSLRPS